MCSYNDLRNDYSENRTKKIISMSSSESQKGINAFQQCSVENQKDSIATDFAQH